MSLHRLALRLAAIEALAPTGATAWPTIAGPRVFDSRLVPIDGLRPEERAACVVVYTEHDNRDPLPKFGPPYRRAIELRFEMMVLAAEGEGDEYQVGHPITDSEIEAELDLLEEQILFALEIGPTGRLFRDIGGLKITDIQSVPERTAEDGVRVAIRGLRVKVDISSSCASVHIAGQAGASGLDRLPDPLFQVAQALPPNAPGRVLAESIAAATGSNIVTAVKPWTLAGGIDANVPKDDTPDVAFTAAPPE